jgi:hypothetical protein
LRTTPSAALPCWWGAASLVRLRALALLLLLLLLC